MDAMENEVEIDCSTLTAEFRILNRTLKYHFFKALTEETEAFVHINLEKKEALLPEHLNKGPTTVLKFSPRYGPRLDIMEEGIRQTLTFQGQDFDIFVSWDAIFAIRDESAHKQRMWRWDGPASLVKDEEMLVTLGHMEVVVKNGNVEFPSYNH